ncbi:type II-A CRISPR-associated protein Csn2 [Peptostreptococcus anaerobius]|uniref:type II-A CRISPR-associated protein Csn2 n=1 Tax=Peptostreptococcus TaxID=1257 RepID=UPI00033FAFB0|nr:MULTISPECIES: type II-A CRISPR-associated protein Csn2 [Peptostreptococcus]MDB8821863.1 type II-A CRISPR-associated protein Csn2 [Peptostreptococcus anaerobius]MDB8826535.1 type II-A CRISPR-associated protein Csn2 [Peptostreptococcus anaerobius]MDB8828358.1 type II-A CRISPR-associated protein Csn2 [Peptostreptococcus anaerobius]MDB8830159.1 type II-A CRISPR-associated protein Csn2 [Peptostreptococcus anaerobius]MDB8832070.1 type II-A CRISPR-associated protein Csn2 [Peptostreptococcus anaero
MKLVNTEWERAIEFEESKISTVVIEDAKYFRYVVKEFINQNNGWEGKFILSDSNKEIDIGKKVMILSDIFDLNSSIKRANSKLIQYLKIISLDYFEETQAIVSKLEMYLDEIVQEVSLPICRSEGIKIEEIFKASDIHVDMGNDIIENIINTVDICTSLLDTKLFVLINIHNILSKEEREYFIKSIVAKKCNVLVFESEIPRYTAIDSGFEKLYIIDNELCEL